MTTPKNKHQSVTQGIYWNSLATLLGAGQKFIVQLVLARILIPEDFGKVGMVVVFTTIIFAISELGLAAALIQRKESLLKPIHYDTVFWVSLGFGLTLFALLSIVIAPAVAWFYDEAILRELAMVVSATVIIAPFSLVHRARMTRDLNFKAIAICVGISSFIGGAICITYAINGGGVWSMALMGPITALINVPCMWYMSNWMPKMQFSREALQDVFGFGFWVALERGTMAIAQNLDFLLIGRLLGAQSLGVYSLAFTLTDTLRSKIGGALGSAVFPAYSKVQSDPEKLKNYYLLTIKFSTLVLFPVLVILIVAAEEIILVGFGEKWGGAIFPLQMLALAGIIHTIGGTSGIVIRSMGRSKLEFYIYVWKSIFITVPALVAGVYYGGIEGAAIATAGHKLAMRFIQQYYMRKFINVSEIDVIRSFMAPLISCIVMSVIIFALLMLSEPSLPLLAFSIIAGGIAYVICIFFLAPAEVKKIKNSLGRGK